jgi:hypothetical protein
MRTQEQLRKFYLSVDTLYDGTNPPKGWRFVDPEADDIKNKENLMSFNRKEWFKLEGKSNDIVSELSHWVWITDLPLPEGQEKSAAKNPQRFKTLYVVRRAQNHYASEKFNSLEEALARVGQFFPDATGKVCDEMILFGDDATIHAELI